MKKNITVPNAMKTSGRICIKKLRGAKDNFFSTRIVGSIKASGRIYNPLQIDYTTRMTYSSDFCRKILSVREQDELTVSEVISRFGVGVASVSALA
ncbi:MAG: hypothetical protein HRT36_08355 [Alphaproteobacteria bacterium]|nr:hypothetical protein [Alphaproteobacteria bacterium]